MAATTLPPPPNSSPLAERTGMPSSHWARWFSLLQSILSGFTQSFAFCTQASGQSIPNGVATTINFDTVASDDDGAVATGAAWTWTCPAGKAGMYQVSANAGGTGATAFTDGFLSVFVNGVEGIRGARFGRTPAGYTYWNVSGVVTVEVGETVLVKLFQTQSVAAALTLEASTVSNWISIARIPGG